MVGFGGVHVMGIEDSVKARMEGEGRGRCEGEVERGEGREGKSVEGESVKGERGEREERERGGRGEGEGR